MEARLAEFAELLRHNGLRVSSAELIDATRATVILGVEDRDVFRAALEATLVKRARDRTAFGEVFDLYFTGAAHMLDAIDASLARSIREQGLAEGDELKMVIATLETLAAQMSPLARAILDGDRGALARLFRQSSLQLDFGRMESQFQQGFFARRLLSGAGGGQAQRDLDSISSELRARGASPQTVEMVSHELAAQMRKVEQAARDEVGRQTQARVARLREAAHHVRQIADLPRDELEKMQLAVRRLAERLKARLVRRQRKQHRGQLAVRRTIRANLGWGGIPAKLAFRTRRPERPDVVVFCDVSDSVRNVSRVMLLFTHTLQSLFHRVRSFVFVSDVGETTELFRGTDVREAIELAVAGRAVSLHANSNYGHALATFAREHLGAVNRKTTFLVIGDGRNNFNPPHVWALREIKRKARRLIWICPEERYAFGTGDSEMLLYARECDRVATVRTLADLEDVADALVPRR